MRALAWTRNALTLLAIALAGPAALAFFVSPGLALVAWAIVSTVALPAIAVDFYLRHRRDVERDEYARDQRVKEGRFSPPQLRRLESLSRASKQLKLRQRFQSYLTKALTSTVFAVTIFGAAYHWSDDRSARHLAIIAAVLAITVVALQITRERAHELEADYRQVEHEEAVLDARPRQRAQTLFLKHQFDLRRYYEQTLRQGALVFYLGIAVLALGAAVVITALALIATEDDPTSSEIVVAALAAVGGLLTNGVAYVYLKIHAGSLQAVSEFHERMVDQHSSHFAHLLVESKPRYSRTTLDQLAFAVLLRMAPDPTTADEMGAGDQSAGEKESKDDELPRRP